MGLRVSEEEKLAALDVSQHGERAYAAPVGLLSTVAAAASALSLDDTAHSTVRRSARKDGGGQQRLPRQITLSQESLQGSPG